MTKIVLRLDARPLWGWAAILHHLFGAPYSGADWKPVSSILAARNSDERGLRLAQSLCPGVKVKTGSGEVLAPTVLKRDDSFIELSDGVRTARLLTSAHKGGAIIEVVADFDDSKVEEAMFAAVVRVVDRTCSAAGTVFIPHQERNLVGIALGEAGGVLAA